MSRDRIGFLPSLIILAVVLVVASFFGLRTLQETYSLASYLYEQQLTMNVRNQAAQGKWGVAWDDLGPYAQTWLRENDTAIAEAEKQLGIARAAEPKRGYQLSQEQADASNNVRSKASKVVQDEMVRLGVDMPTFARTVSGWRLNDERYQQWQDDVVKAMSEWTLVAPPGLTDAAKKAKLEKAIADVKKKAYDSIKKVADDEDKARYRQLQQQGPQQPPWAQVLQGIQRVMAR